MPPVNSKFPGTPSPDSSHNNLFPSLSSFLHDKNNRKLYNVMLQSTKKYAKVVSKIYFLQKCIEGKIIPRTLLITNRPGSENVPPEWTAATETCCLELLRVALELEEARKVVIGNELKDTCKQLVCLAGDNMILIEQLSSRLASKTVQFEAEQMVLKDECNNLTMIVSSSYCATDSD